MIRKYLDCLSVCKESSVRLPGVSGFCYRASEFCFQLAWRASDVFEEFDEQKNCEINSASQKVFGASWNDVWASKC